MTTRTVILVSLLSVGSSVPCGLAGNMHVSTHGSGVQDALATGTALVVSGRIASADPVLLDLEAIMEFPRTSFVSSCPWTGSEHNYTGVLISALLDSLGLDDGATSIEVRAANRYSVRIRIDDLRRHRYMLAYEMDGALIEQQNDLEDRGALVTTIEFDPEHDVDLGVYRYQVVWQVNEIVVL